MNMKEILDEIKNLLIENAFEVHTKEYGNIEVVGIDAINDVIEGLQACNNNGWIPCSERLPKEGGYYLVTYHEWTNGEYLPKSNDTYVKRLHYQKTDHFTGWNFPQRCSEKAEADTNREVLAWMPLPELYKG
jgi:hypothetical protein